MTTYVDARDALISRLHSNWPTAYPTVPVYYENNESVDMDAVGSAFLKVELAFDDAEQASVEATPLMRVRGMLILGIMAKEGTGTRGGMAYLDYLVGLFKHQNLSGVQTGTPTPGHRESHDGWHLQELYVPFWFHSSS